MGLHRLGCSENFDAGKQEAGLRDRLGTHSRERSDTDEEDDVRRQERVSSTVCDEARRGARRFRDRE